MALGPREVAEINDTEKDFLKQLEIEIDSQLKKLFYGSGEAIISLNLIKKGCRPDVIKCTLKEKYLAAGWTDITFDLSQRDGTMITFSYEIPLNEIANNL